MDTKICTYCGEEKPLTAEYFNRRRSTVSGYQSWCKICKNKYHEKWCEANREKVLAGQKKWREENPEKKKAQDKKWREANREKVLARKKKWCEVNREKIRVYKKKWYEVNREKVNAGQKKWREVNPEKKKAQDKKWREANREKVLARKKKYREENRQRPEYVAHVNAYHREYMKNRRRNDPSYRLQCSLRSGLWQCLSGKQKKSRTLEYIGLNTEQLWEHFESKFTDGMTRENYGEWHVDHIRPLSSFDFYSCEEGSEEFENLLYQAWDYTNLQPLWAKDNLSKNSKWEGNYEV